MEKRQKTENAKRECTEIFFRILPVLMTAACLVFSWAVFGVRYEVDDDAVLSNIAAGAYGPHSERLVFINIIIGWLLKPLYHFLPGHNWLVIGMLLCGIAAVTVLCRLMLERFGRKQGVLLSAALLFLAGIELFNGIQSVKFSGICLIAGFALAAQNLGTWNRRMTEGIILVLTGSLLRLENFAAVGAMAAALLLWKFHCRNRSEKKRAFWQMLLIFTLVFFCASADYAAYHTDAAWKEYTQYNAARSEFSDFAIYNAPPETIIENSGISPNDYGMLASWSYYDPGVFPREKLEKISASVPPKPLLKTVKETAYTGVHMLYGQPFRLLLPLVLLGWALFSGSRGRAAFAGTIGMLGVLTFYLIARGRFIHRVEYVLVLAAAVFGILCCTEHEKRKINYKILFCGVLAACVLSVPVYLRHYRYMENYRVSRTDVPGYTQCAQDGEHLYFADVSVSDALAGYDVFHPRPAGFFDNIVELGGWVSAMPHRNEVMHRYGAENPYEAIAKNPAVRLIDGGNRPLKEEYWREHYGWETEWEQIGSIPPVAVYEVRIAENAPESAEKQ